MKFESQALEQAGNEQLERLAAEFDQWRAQKKSQAERIPESLVREVQKLSQLIDASQIRKRLNITYKQMDRLRSLGEPSQQPAADTNFLKLVPHTAQPQTTVEPQALRIDIRTPQGMKITLSGFAGQDPLAMIAKLIGR